MENSTSALSEFKNLKSDLKSAIGRVGDPASWLLAFAYKNLSKLTKKEISEIGLEVLAVAYAGVKKQPDDEGDMTHVTGMEDHFTYYSRAGLFSKNPDDLLLMFQRELKKRFEDCRRGEVWEFIQPPLRQRFELFSRVRDLPRVYLAYPTHETPLESLLGYATTVLLRERERFGLCANPRCGNAFVAERKRRAKYCSPTCAAYVNVNKARGKL